MNDYQELPDNDKLGKPQVIASTSDGTEVWRFNRAKLKLIEHWLSHPELGIRTGGQHFVVAETLGGLLFVEPVEDGIPTQDWFRPWAGPAAQP